MTCTPCQLTKASQTIPHIVDNDKIVAANRRGEWEGEGESHTSKLWEKIMNLRSGLVSFKETFWRTHD